MRMRSKHELEKKEYWKGCKREPLRRIIDERGAEGGWSVPLHHLPVTGQLEHLAYDNNNKNNNNNVNINNNNNSSSLST